jgi:hypothetical protein
MLETESIVKAGLAQHYGLSEKEVCAILDGSYKPKPLQFPTPQPAFDRQEWHRDVKPTLTDAQIRAVVENARADQEVKEAVTETPMHRLEKFERMTGVPSSWLK